MQSVRARITEVSHVLLIIIGEKQPRLHGVQTGRRIGWPCASQLTLGQCSVCVRVRQ